MVRDLFFLLENSKPLLDLQQGIALKTSQFLTITLAILLVAFLFYFLQKTKTGKAMRAYSDNTELALLSGIDPDKVVQITWLLVALFTTIAGTLYGLDKGFAPQQYHLLLLPIFASVIVGGIGSPIGAIAGAFLVAFSEILLTYAYKKFLNLFTSTLYASKLTGSAHWNRIQICNILCYFGDCSFNKAYRNI